MEELSEVHASPSVDTKESYFEKLLSEAQSVEEFKKCANLLSQWCSNLSEDNLTCFHQCWFKLYTKLLNEQHVETIFEIHQKLTESYLTQQEELQIIESLQQYPPVYTSHKFGILSHYASIKNESIKAILGPFKTPTITVPFTDEDSDYHDLPCIYHTHYDAALLSYILIYTDMTEFALTPFYPHLVDLLLKICGLSKNPYDTTINLIEEESDRNRDFNSIAQKVEIRGTTLMEQIISNLLNKKLFFHAMGLVLLYYKIHPQFRTVELGWHLLDKYTTTISNKRNKY